MIKYNREFLGTLVTAENYKEIIAKEGRDGRNFHNKHLRAYKQGKTHFIHGVRINEKGEKLGPMIHQVQQKINLVE